MMIGLRAQAGLLLLRLTPNSLFQEALSTALLLSLAVVASHCGKAS